MDRVSSLLHRVSLIAASALVCVSAYAQSNDIRQPVLSSVGEAVMDIDRDGSPDLLNQSVNLAGRIVLPRGSTPFGSNTAYLQDRTGGILLTGIESGHAEGDSVRVSGKVSVFNDRVSLEVLTTTAADAANKLPIASWIEDDLIDLDEYLNTRVEVSGKVVHVERFEERSHVVINRAAGPIYVHVPHLGQGNDYLRANVGEFVRAKGVLVDRRASTYPPVQLLVTDYQAFTPSIPVENFFDWGIAVMAVILCVIGYLLFSKVRGHVKGKREHPYKAMFDQAGNAIVVVDGNLKINYANKTATTILGQSPANIRSQSIEKLLTLTGGVSSFTEVIQDLRRGKHKTVTAFIDDDRTAKPRMLDVTLSVVKMGGRKAILAMINDVTNHADDVEKYKLFHEELLDGMPVEVAILSLQGKYLYMNSAGLVDNITKDWLIGKTDVELCKRLNLSPDIGLRRRAHWRRAITSGQVVRFEEVITSGDQLQHILRSFQPIKDSTGDDVAAVVAFGLDITELKESREMLDKARGEVSEVNQLKESFLENINHEFRTPITGIIGFAEILEDEVADEQREFVNMIERNGRRLMNTLNAVLDLAGLNNNEFNLSPTVFNLVDEAKLIIEGSREMAEQKGLFLKLEVARPEINTFADQVCLARVVQNLIDNSIKFTDAGGIIVEVDGDDKAVNVRVLDTGVGIDREFVPMVFDDFNRAGELSGSFEGVGIGLGITKRLVELMHGTISLESQKEEGSIFSISLPRAFPARSKYGSGKPRILLVDDSSDVNTMIQYMLAEFFTIDRAVNLRELEALTKRHRYDVMLVDMSLMKHDMVLKGLAEARERYEDVQLPVIGIAEGNRRNTETVEIPEDFDHVLMKPFKKSELLTFMSMILVNRDAFSDDDDNADERVYLKAG